jgi:PhnB protein
MQPATLDAYIFFIGNCREAMSFYQTVFGGKLDIRNLADIPGIELTEHNRDSVMHARLSGGLINLMASDGDRREPYPAGAISLSITGTDDESLRGVFAALSEGGEITSELKKEMWGDIFGALTDKYGTEWLVNISQPSA